MSERTYSRRALVGGSVITAALIAETSSRAALADTGLRVWRPAQETPDAWLDQPGTRHRLVIDSASAAAAEASVSMADTFYVTNASGYGLEPQALGVVIVLRHLATPFAYDDEIWVRFGASFAQRLGLVGDEAIRATHGNPLLGASASKDDSQQRKNDGSHAPTLTSLAAKGTRFAVCGAATAYLARVLATSDTPSARVERDLRDHLIPGGVLMASGIVAVNRAQEHGYAFLPAMP